MRSARYDPKRRDFSKNSERQVRWNIRAATFSSQYPTLKLARINCVGALRPGLNLEDVLAHRDERQDAPTYNTLLSLSLFLERSVFAPLWLNYQYSDAEMKVARLYPFEV